ncbi:MAG: glycogen/starch synthase [Deferribacteraceae bacterium]|jgi:starch synthase|nr:glycogen/starch synthase [Deferribacteraceae bacterium]
MKIAQITPEIYPFSALDRRGYNQLRSNILLLSQNLALHGHEVFVFTPLYGSIDKQEHGLNITDHKTWVSVSGKIVEFEIYEKEMDGIYFYFFSNSGLFDRNGVYGYGNIDFTDNEIRFGAFCQACLNFINTNIPDMHIMHSHNWPAALIPTYKSYRYPKMKCKTVLTIHDLAVQGIFNRFSMETLSLPWDMYTMECLEYYDNINILKGGIVYANAVIALNVLQAESFLMHDTGFGLDGVFRRHQNKLVTIANGIDSKSWDPLTDAYLDERYNWSSLGKRKINKVKFCERFSLDNEKPLFCVINRYVSKEGIDIVLKTLPSIMKNDMRLFLYGRGEEPYVDKLFEQQRVYENIRVVKDNDPAIFHNILASADFIVITSGTPSMEKERRLAMRYGAIPIIRGYVDICDTTRTAKNEVIGFKNLDDFELALQKAISFYYDKENKDRHISEIMQCDNSWDFTAKEHEELYYGLINSRKQNNLWGYSK